MRNWKEKTKRNWGRNSLTSFLNPASMTWKNIIIKNGLGILKMFQIITIWRFFIFLLTKYCLEFFFDGDSFTNDIIIPNFEKIKEKFGVAPVIVRLYPDNQNEEEDFYWRSCPPGVNETIIKYANSNNLNIKIIEKNNKQNLTKKTNYNKL